MTFHLFDKFILLTLDQKKGKFLIDSFTLNYGLAGAILLELSELKKIEIKNRRIVVVDHKLINHQIIDASIKLINKSGKYKRPKYWIYKIGNKSSGFKKVILNDLYKNNIVKVDVSSYLWGMIKIKRYPVVNSKSVDEIIEKIRKVVLDKLKPDVEVILLLSLLASCKLTRILFSTKKEHREAKRRIKELTKDIEISEAVNQTLKEIQAALVVATTSAFVSSSSS